MEGFGPWTHLAAADCHSLDGTVLVLFDLGEANRSVSNVLAWLLAHDKASGRYGLTVHLLPRSQEVFRILERDEPIFCLL